MTEKKAASAGGFDISQFSQKEDDSQGQFLHLAHPIDGTPLYDDNENEIGIYLHGRDSDVYRGAQRTITNRRLNAKGGSASITAERIEAEGIEVLAKCTIKWQGILYDGKELVCNVANAKKMYSKEVWLKEQVDEFVAERTNFLGK